MCLALVAVDVVECTMDDRSLPIVVRRVDSRENSDTMGTRADCHSPTELELFVGARADDPTPKPQGKPEAR